MGILDWYDTNHDGHFSGAEIDRFQLDHAEYPGMFERANDKYDWDDDDDDYRYSDSFLDREEKRRKTIINAGSSLDYLIDDDEDEDDDDWDADDDDDDEWDDDADDDADDVDEDDWDDDDDDDQPATMDVNIVGTKYNDRADIWLTAKSDPDCVIELSREYANDYDENAIAVYVDGEHAGYVPRNVAKKLAPLMDDGAELTVTGKRIKSYTNADGEECVSVTLTVQSDS